MKTTDKPEAISNASTLVVPLTPAESRQLADYEKIIADGKDAFLKVADALQDIRDQRLYRIGYSTFEIYCRDKWKFTARQANRLMSAGQVMKNLKSDQLVSSEKLAIPTNESQARSLTSLPPQKQIEVARKVAAKTGNHTAKQFEQTVIEVTEEKPRVNVTSKSNTKTTTGKASMESLIEMIDDAQTMVKTGKHKDVILLKLKAAADLATQINNGGSVC